MKPLFWGVGLLAALLALCLGATARLSAGSAQTEQALAEAQAAARLGDGDLALDRALEAKRRWEAHIAFIDAVTSHEETDEITRGLAELTSYAEMGRREEFRALCARLMAHTAHLRQMERACWYNILSAPLFSANGLYFSK